MEHPSVKHAIVMLRQVEDQVSSDFLSMDHERLNWKPAEDSWSIAECLDHLLQTNTHYLQQFEAVKNRTVKLKWVQNLPGWNKLCGHMILRAVDPQSKRKVKTFDIFEPRASDLPVGVTEEFLQNIKDLISVFIELDHYSDLTALAMPSPVSGWITLQVETAMEIIWKHSVRHLQQAQRVARTPGFPSQTA